LKAAIVTPEFYLDYHQSGGELTVSGQVELPEGFPLAIQIYSGVVLVAVDTPVIVRTGTFETRPMLARGNAFKPGPYRIVIEPARNSGPPGGEGPPSSNSPPRFQFSADFSLDN
jgi:hypothetical protein